MRVLLIIVLTGLLFTGCLQEEPTERKGGLVRGPDPVVPPSPPAADEPTMPIQPTQVGHTFIIVLENKGYETNFGTDIQSQYLGEALPSMGRLLTNYHGTSHASLGNYITLVSGQAANPFTQADCFAYVDFVMATMDEDGQAVGQGCVYPPEVKTIGDQLDDAGISWRMYAEDMAAIPDEAPTTCRHQPVNSQDTWTGTTDERDQYATRHVPFVYFHSVIDDQARCDERVVDLSLLEADLQSAETTPQWVFITPDVCSDGHDNDCGNPEQAGGYEGIEQFLRHWVPLIMNSTAFQQDGMLFVTFDEANPADPEGAGACCDQPTGPNTPQPGLLGPGGGRVGGVLLSPCIEAGTVDETPYNHYSLLRTWEDIFGLPYLGYAGMDGLVPLDLGACNPA